MRERLNMKVKFSHSIPQKNPKYFMLFDRKHTSQVKSNVCQSIMLLKFALSEKNMFIIAVIER